MGGIIDIGEIKAQINGKLSGIASMAAGELHNGFLKSIEDFYGAYQPVRYRRTRSSRNASSPQVSGGNLHYQAKLEVGGSFMGEPYLALHHGKNFDASSAHVFDEMTWEGSHGGYVTTTAPQSIMDQEYDRVCNLVDSMLGSM